MKLRTKRVILGAVAVLVIVLVIIVLVFLPARDPREGQAHRLVEELRATCRKDPPSIYRQWLMRLGFLRPRALRDKKEIARDIAALGRVSGPYLVRALKDDNSDLRRRAAWLLGPIAHPSRETVAALRKVSEKDADREVRMAAVQALGNIGPGIHDVIPTIAKALSDPDRGVRIYAAGALRGIGPAAKGATEALIRAMGDQDTTVRSSAVGAIGSIGPEANAAVPALIEHLKDTDIYVRWNTAYAMGLIGPKAHQAVPDLVQALMDNDSSVRCRAAQALGRIGPPPKEVRSVLVRALKDENKYVRIYAASALAGIDPALTAKAVLPVLLESLRHRGRPGDQTWLVRLRAAQALARIGPDAKGAIPALRKALKDEKEQVRTHAASALAGIEPALTAEAVLPVLIELLEHPGPWGGQGWCVRFRAAEALGRIGADAKPAIPALREALTDDHEDVREAAAEALGKIAPAAKEVAPALERALKDEDKFVRCAAGAALAKLGLPGKGLPVLIGAMEDILPYPRAVAARMLGEVGPPAKAAIPALKQALKDGPWRVRKAAAEALEKIQQAQPTTGPTRPAKDS